ncbi:hypothetical protein QCA50_002322 [Cerrena zonata]|uniref:Uncharacterized protein n=1 Tax=Cerrena zonata TaxID=2478898 RepID=A0AAW0GT59_9APHY
MADTIRILQVVYPSAPLSVGVDEIVVIKRIYGHGFAITTDQFVFIGQVSGFGISASRYRKLALSSSRRCGWMSVTSTSTVCDGSPGLREG